MANFGLKMLENGHFGPKSGVSDFLSAKKTPKQKGRTSCEVRPRESASHPA